MAYHIPLTPEDRRERAALIEADRQQTVPPRMVFTIRACDEAGIPTREEMEAEVRRPRPRQIDPKATRARRTANKQARAARKRNRK